MRLSLFAKAAARFRQSGHSVTTHALCWVGFAVYEQSVLYIAGPMQFNVLFLTLNYLLNAVVFYVHCEGLLPRLYARRRYVAYGAGLLATLGGYALLRSELYRLFPAMESGEVRAHTDYLRLWTLSVYRGTFFVLVSAAYWFARNLIWVEKQKRLQEQQLLDTEKSLMKANLAFLKSQINPHFLFNSLNFLYAQVYPHSEEAARGILLLSDTMRYALHEGDTSGKVMLEQEVQHLRNYISLNQLRFGNRLQVQFNVTGNIQFLMILPLVLITFVENCFKHGELADATNPLVITLDVVRDQLRFRTHNKKRHGPKEKSTGIGLVNTRRRLDLVYPDRYALVLDETPDDYTCTLTIAL